MSNAPTQIACLKGCMNTLAAVIWPSADMLWSLFWMQNYIFLGVPTTVWANGWIWMVQQMDPNTWQLWHILNHKYSRSVLVCLQQVRETAHMGWKGDQRNMKFRSEQLFSILTMFFLRIIQYRHTLAFGLTLVESNLDKLSAWNQGVIAHFLEKVKP